MVQLARDRCDVDAVLRHDQDASLGGRCASQQFVDAGNGERLALELHGAHRRATGSAGRRLANVNESGMGSNHLFEKKGSESSAPFSYRRTRSAFTSRVARTRPLQEDEGIQCDLKQ